MQKCDILLTYEIRNREIENICLLKYELERRGYSVGLCMQYDTFFKVPEPVEAEVVVIPGYYRPRAIFYTSSHLLKTKKIVNLRWEQVATNEEEADSQTLCSIKSWGFDAVHLAWGKHAVDKMVKEWGVPLQNVKLVGHIGLDYLRGKLRNYFMDKESILKKYNIPINKRINLFISSLVFGSYPAYVMDNSTTNNDSTFNNKRIEETKETQRILLSWFENILEENLEDIIIYRPHPEERNSILLKQLATKQPRFFVIGEESVKQWILISDKIYTWISTSIAEVYSAGKGCSILRPVKIAYENDMCIYDGASFISNYEAFKDDFKQKSQIFNLKEEIIKKHYYIDKNKYSFELACDVIEDVYKNEKYLLKKPLDNPFKGFFNKEKIGNYIKRIIANSKICNLIYNKNMFPDSKFRYFLDDVIYVREKLKKNYVTNQEIKEILKKIDICLRERDSYI